MNKSTSCKLTFVLLILLLVAMLSGCGRENHVETPDETVMQPEMTFVSHVTSLSTLSGYLPNIDNSVHALFSGVGA